MTRPRLLDLFCKAGGCSVGYHRAGFDVVGVDIDPQPRYPFSFVCGDAIDTMNTLLAGGAIADNGGSQWRLSDFDAFGASPPCQIHSILASLFKGTDYSDRHPDLIPITRQTLVATGKPYVIENVIGAPLMYPTLLCGAMFGLKVYRHRLFETSFFMLAPPHVPHKDKCQAVGRGISPKGFISVTGNGGFGMGKGGMDYARQAMGVDWMNRAELSQAIPPAFTQYIGERLLEVIHA